MMRVMVLFSVVATDRGPSLRGTCHSIPRRNGRSNEPMPGPYGALCTTRLVHHAPSLVYAAPVVKRALLTWSDAGTIGPAPAHQGPRPGTDRGPIRRLLDQDESRYDAIWLLTIPAG